MQRTTTFVALAALGLFASPSTARAETITVCASGCDFTSIPDAIDAASAGDVIEIAAGTYTVDSQIQLGQGGVDEPLTIIGETDSDGTLLTRILGISSWDSGTRCFYINGVVGPDTIIENLIITGGSGLERGSGMYCKGDPTIINCHFLNNAVHGLGGGMYNEGGSPTLTNCTFTGNTATWGGGMYNNNGGKPTLNNCTFSGNSAPHGGAMHSTSNSDPILTNAAICENSVPQISGDYTDGGGNCIIEVCDADTDGVPDCIDQCLGEDDTIDSDGDGTPDCEDGCENDPDKTEPGACGCGVPEDNCGDDITVAVGDSIADAVTAVASGGTIVLEAGTHIVDSQILLGQGGVDKPLTIIGETAADGTPLTSIQATSGTRCLYVFGHVGPDTIIENLIITGGSGLERGAGIYCKGDPTIINCHLLDNAVAERGAGMYHDGGKPTLIHCLFTGNSAPVGGAMYNTGNSDPILTNVVICANSAPQISGDYTDGGGNCISDSCEDTDDDGIPNECEPCPADFNGDGRVDAADLGLLIGAWGTADPAADINGDGSVDAADLGLLIGAWGLCP